MASNIDVVKTIPSYNISVLCLYLCVCMSVANIGPYFKTRSSKFPLLFTMPVAVASLLLWPHCNTSCILPVLWMTSCFRVMTKSQKPLQRATPYASAVHAVVVCLSVCLSVTSRCVSNQLNGSSWCLYGSFFPLFCKEIRVSAKIRIFPLQLCPKFYTWLEQFRQGKSILLSTKFMDAQACWPHLWRPTCG